MATIGLIGAGRIGRQVARLAVAHGYDVVLSNSRGPETLQDLIQVRRRRCRTAAGRLTHPARHTRIWPEADG